VELAEEWGSDTDLVEVTVTALDRLSVFVVLAEADLRVADGVRERSLVRVMDALLIGDAEFVCERVSVTVGATEIVPVDDLPSEEVADAVGDCLVLV
jgi:hypothetical protein